MANDNQTHYYILLCAKYFELHCGLGTTLETMGNIKLENIEKMLEKPPGNIFVYSWEMCLLHLTLCPRH